MQDNEINFNIGDVMNTKFDPKTSQQLVVIPKDATLEELIDFLNDLNFTIFDKELEKKWKRWMPNLTDRKTA